jgi:DNA-binding Lrp family transcriptional regulator
LVRIAIAIIHSETKKKSNRELLNYAWVYIRYIITNVIMPTAYVLINCDLGYEDEIISELNRLPGIIEATGVYGAYDILVKVNAETVDSLKETITWHLRRIDKIKSTLTLMVIEGQGSD